MRTSPRSRRSVRRRITGCLAALGAALLALSGVQAPPATAAAPRPAAGTRSPLESSCPTAARDEFTCFALRRTDQAAARTASADPAGYGPADLRSAYDLPANGGEGQTVAIVDAFDDPTAEADLAVYREQFGLPACTGDTGCFRKVDQRGGTDYPAPDPGWADEISLDLDMVSAVAPRAHILLVEADDDQRESLGAAVDQAVALGAKFVSNSYGSYYDSLPGGG